MIPRSTGSMLVDVQCKGVLGSESRTRGRLGSPAVGRLKNFWNLS